MNPDGHDIHRVVIAIVQHPLAASLTALAVLTTLAITVGCGRRLIGCAHHHGWQGEKAGTLVAAAIATGVSAQGMWVFMQDALHLEIVMRLMFFGFLETMTITSALRARTAQRVTGSAGVDGIAMWVLTSLSAVLSATEADNLGTVLIRLSAPLVAAWGWERSMALERRRSAGRRSRINWTITPERLLVRLRLADPDPGRTASDADRQQKVIALALAVDDARAIRDSRGASTRRIRSAHHRLRKAMRHAINSGGLIAFDGRDHREVLVDHIAALRSTSALLDLETPNPWPAAHPMGASASAAPPLHAATSDAGHPDVPTVAAPASRSDANVTPIRSRAHHQESPTAHRVTAESASSEPQPAIGSAMLRTGAQQDEERHPDRSAWPACLNNAWSDIAAKLCSEDPARRRDPGDVQEILRLWHDDRQTYPEIAKLVDGYSKHAVGRVIRQARKYHKFEHSDQVQRVTGERG